MVFILQMVPLTVSKQEVVRYFLRLEAGRKKYSDLASDLLSWVNLPDRELLIQARKFADQRDDTTPLLVYTVGTSKDDRSNSISIWKREFLKCAQIYTLGISQNMLADLEQVKGNVLNFALQYATKYPEFSNPPQRPDGKIPRLIVIAQSNPSSKGSYELIDGAHRLVALCRLGDETVEAYVGYPTF